MARLAVSTVVIGAGTFVLTFLTALNGYCGDSVAADEESRCHFQVATQASLFVVVFPLIAGLAVYGASRMPRVRERWKWIAAGVVTCALLAVAAQWLLDGIRDKLDYWHSGGGGVNAPAENFGSAALLATLAPIAAWATAGGGRGSARLLSYATALAAALWLVAVAYSAWYYDRHF